MIRENDLFDRNVREYRNAIDKYNSNPWYHRIQLVFSVIVLLFQVLTIFQLFYHRHLVTIFGILFVTAIAYILADFINGLIHMMMDNNTNYTSIVGPFVAAFHLHHKRLIYKYSNSAQVYFYESGQKYWLVFYLIFLLIAQHYFNLNIYLNLLLVLIGILSSIAEVSHFWCHNATKNNSIIRFLQSSKILLSMKHHIFHHRKDNVNYAFLNGMTDPLLNQIASFCFRGYKNRADAHVTKAMALPDSEFLIHDS